MLKKLLSYLGPAVGTFLLVVSIAVVRNELKSYSFQDIAASFTAISAGQLAVALTFTALGYTAMTGYDALAFLYLQQPLAYRRIALANFLSSAFSNTIGFAWLTGSAIRFRLLSAWGISAGAIAQVIAFSNFSFWLGLLAMGGAAFAIDPLPIPTQLNLPFATARPLGFLFLGLALAYLLGSVTLRSPLTIGKHIFRFPPVRIAISQIIISSLDWAMAAAVLFALLPAIELSYFSVLSVYLLAMAAGVISNMPGGVGVFETVIILLLAPYLPAAIVLASLLAYRVTYYFVPFVVAAGLFLAQETYVKKRRVRAKPTTVKKHL